MPAKEKVTQTGSMLPGIVFPPEVYCYAAHLKTRRMTIYVNNELREITPPSTLQDLLEACQVQSVRGLAIAVNNQVIARSAWERHHLKTGDRVTLIRASKGG
jgi:sulfur carrier protein